MNYDYHIFSKREPFVGFNAPLFKEVYEFGPLSKLNSDYSTRFWLASGMPASKIVFGIPTYGRGYTLLYSWLHFPYSPAVGSAHLGASYSYHEVCKLDHNSTYKYVFNRRARSPYLYGGNKQWLGFEHSSSVFIKAAYARYMQLAGIMVFDIGSDDYQGYCGGDRYPLLKAARAGFLNLSRKNL
ncbi:hypothetical protein AB6A40_008229 [Gnathostoma spinigerum]|uniref:GH18 domain-containing protein n=1 Tax=Gnathostoma spinigerum TaxID=75299 RepID=A0ABD6EPQ8_9BILA